MGGASHNLVAVDGDIVGPSHPTTGQFVEPVIWSAAGAVADVWLDQSADNEVWVPIAKVTDPGFTPVVIPGSLGNFSRLRVVNYASGIISGDLTWTSGEVPLPAGGPTVTGSAGQVAVIDADGNLVGDPGVMIVGTGDNAFVQSAIGLRSIPGYGLFVQAVSGPPTPGVQYGGGLNLRSGDAVDGSETPGDAGGGAIDIRAGAAVGLANGGAVNVTAGSGATGGAVNITSGDSSSATAGDVRLLGGQSTFAGAQGGTVRLNGGENAAGDGGDVQVAGGDGLNHGGNIALSPGNGIPKGSIQLFGRVHAPQVLPFANNAAALAGGLIAGDLYYTDSAGEYIIKIAHA